jgi:hypothetical protein
MSSLKICALVLATALSACAQGRLSQVDLEPVAPPLLHPDAFAPGSISRACTFGLRNLEDFFDKHGVPFDPHLVRSHKGRDCHLYLEPSSKWILPATDLTLTRDPNNPARTILLYGDEARALFGHSVSDDEYAYLLRVKFAVDEAIHVRAGD